MIIIMTIYLRFASCELKVLTLEINQTKTNVSYNTHIHTHIHTRTHIHTHTHTHSHTHTHTHARTHIHTHTQKFYFHGRRGESNKF